VVSPFCKEHYEILFLVPCTKCGEPITERYFENEGKAYHSHCWTCTHCDCDLNDGYVMQLGAPYCENHYVELFAPRCASCTKPIHKQQSINVSGKEYHVDCFKCDRCDKAMNGKVWYVDDEHICTDCFEETCPTCNKCNKKILKTRGTNYSQLEDKFYHGHCLTCSSEGCDKKGVAHGPDIKLYCADHAVIGLTSGEKCEKCGMFVVSSLFLPSHTYNTHTTQARSSYQPQRTV
jgi:hypothetical protein